MIQYFRNIWNGVFTACVGMRITAGYLFKKGCTLQYPDEVWPVPSRNIGVGDLESYNVIRSKLDVNMDDCIGCKQCERACPVGVDLRPFIQRVASDVEDLFGK